jgi:cation transport regulator ChaC
MEKTFRDVRLGDTIFVCEPESSQVKTTVVESINKREGITFSDYLRGGYLMVELEKLDEKWLHDHRRGCLLFANEEHAIRYAKAQTLRVLRAKKEHARRAIKSVIEYRKEHYDVLNNSPHIDADLNKLEEELKQHLI